MFGLVEADQRVACWSDRVCNHTEGEQGAAPSRTPQVSSFSLYFFGGLECVGHSFAYVAYFVFLLEMSGFEPRELP